VRVIQEINKGIENGLGMFAIENFQRKAPTPFGTGRFMKVQNAPKDQNETERNRKISFLCESLLL
jgi:hypothetical protein